MQLMPRHVITEFLIISMARTVSLSLTTSAAAAAGTLALAYESGALHLRRGSCGGLCWQRRGCKGDTLAQPQPRAHPRGGFGTHTARDGSAGGVHWCQRRRVAADRYLRRVGIQLLPRYTSCSAHTPKQNTTWLEWPAARTDMQIEANCTRARAFIDGNAQPFNYMCRPKHFTCVAFYFF